MIRFIRETNDEEELTISFFGGEPLLEISLIKEIIKRIEKEHFFMQNTI
ncbi:MAG: 4Fe-4S cluster-binding domain-containing protein [Lachnospiraceae bacterium]|nr:4Fe-4S cluster-binding domain-containing protein [Lachnospiraceae bacterium]